MYAWSLVSKVKKYTVIVKFKKKCTAFNPEVRSLYVFGPPGSASESVSHKQGPFPFLIKSVEQTEIMVAN